MVTEKQVEAAARAIAERELGMGDAPGVIKSVVDARWQEYTDLARAALTAAGVKPRVKLLVWGETSYGSPESFTVTGVYRINGAFDGGWSVPAPGRRMLVSSDGRQNFPTIEEAKAAAQADYEARIMSALEDE